MNRYNPVAAMWVSVQRNNNFVYLVVGEGDMPHLEPPFKLEHGEWAPPEVVSNEATWMVFNTSEGAEDFKKFLVESDDKRPSSLRVIRLTLGDVWNLIDEMSQVALDEFSSTLRIKLTHSVPEQQIVAWDVIYSQEELYN